MVFVVFISREGYLDRVRSYLETLDETYDFEQEDDFDISTISDESPEDSVRELRKEVASLKTQVRSLKRMALLNVFESKKDFLDFFADIW